MRITVREHAEQNTRFAPGCFSSQVGKTMPLNVEGIPAGRATLVTAKVSDDGSSVELTLEIAR